jgi:polar amino acid transport system substrate-binding protein
MLKTGGWTMALFFCGGVLCAGAAMAAPPPWLYTAQQATAGLALYTQGCAMCHGAKLEGEAGPALTGPDFSAAGSGNTIGGIFTIIAQQMPATAPGSLTHAQDEDALAYILQQNGYPAGTTPLDYTTSLASTTPLVAPGK